MAHRQLSFATIRSTTVDRRPAEGSVMAENEPTFTVQEILELDEVQELLEKKRLELLLSSVQILGKQDGGLSADPSSFLHQGNSPAPIVNTYEEDSKDSRWIENQSKSCSERQDLPAENFQNGNASNKKIQYSFEDLLNLSESLDPNLEIEIWTHIVEGGGQVLKGLLDCSIHSEPQYTEKKQKKARKPRAKKTEKKITAGDEPSESTNGSVNTKEDSSDRKEAKPSRKKEIWYGLGGGQEDDGLKNDENTNSGEDYAKPTVHVDELSGSDAEEETFLSQAFEVEGKPDFDSGFPEDGMEFLRRVQYERRLCPKTVVAGMPEANQAQSAAKYLPDLPEVATCAPEFLPDPAWERKLLEEFAELREAFSNQEVTPVPGLVLPPVKDVSGWHSFCFGTKNNEPDVPKTENEDVSNHSHEIEESSESQDLNPGGDLGDLAGISVGLAGLSLGPQILPGSNPTAQIESKDLKIAAHDQESWNLESESRLIGSKMLEMASNGSNLELFLSVFGQDIVPGTEGRYPSMELLSGLDAMTKAVLLQYHASWLNDCDALGPRNAVWIYALSAVVEEPLDSQTMAAFRDIFRKGCYLRANLTEGEWDSLPVLNLLITISGLYFGQAGE